jgi:hypothetical protein
MIEAILPESNLSKIKEAIEIERSTTYKYLIEKKVIDKKPEIEKKWMEGIYNRFLLHKLYDDKDSFGDLTPIIYETHTFENKEIDLILESQNLENLFRFVRHPDYDNSGGLKIGFSSNSEKEFFIYNIKNALKLIQEVDPNSYKMIETHLFCICPLHPIESLKQGNVISFSSDYAIGVNFFSPCPMILSAETIIHETRHTVLNSLMKINTYLIDNKITVKTPLREDLRPLNGLLHQAYVLCGLTNFYSKILTIKPYKEMENVKKRYNVHLSDYTDSIRILKENKKYLTEKGLDILKDFSKDILQYG